MAVGQKGPRDASEPVFTRSFLLACVASLGSFLSFYFLLATLPLYVQRIGGAESTVGFVIGLFSVSAVLVRPFAGQRADLVGKNSLMVGGGLVLLASSILYGVAQSTWPPPESRWQGWSSSSSAPAGRCRQ